MAESAGILFKIKGENDDAIRALKETEAATTELSTSAAGMGASLGPVAAAAAIAATAIAAVGTAALAATRAAYDLSKSAAEFGSAIFDASEKTGISAEKLSAMKFAADQSGSSLEQVTAGAAKFAKTIGDAGNGSKEAQAKLDRLGVSSKDLDTALGQALATIAKLPPGTAQMTAAMDAFGKSGADLLPFIKSFDGDLEGLTAKAKELGVTINDDAARAADAFGDQLDTLNAQFDGISRTIGQAFMPVFMDMATSLSNFLTENHEAIERFAQGASDSVRGFIVTIRALDQETQDATNSSLSAWALWAVKMVSYIDPVQNALARVINLMREVGEQDRLSQGKFIPGVGSETDSSFTPPKDALAYRDAHRGGGGGGNRGGGGRSSGESAESKARKAEQVAARDLAAQTKIELVNLKTVQDQMVVAYKAMRDTLGGDDSIAAFTKQTDEATKQWAGNLNRSLTYLEEIEKRALKADATDNERALLQIAQDERRHKLKLAQDEEIKKNEEAAWKLRMDRAEIEAAVRDEQFNKQIEQQKQFEKDVGFGQIPDLAPLQEILQPKEGEDFDAPNIFDHIRESWEAMFAAINGGLPTLQTALEDFNGILQGAFTNLAQAIGSVVQQWVIYGNTGPAVMRKMLAAVLASVAAEAAVKAIMATAEGFYFLATGNYASAANAFTAAAFYGAVAGVAALAGRAIAGDSFKQQSSRATGGSSASSGQGSHGNQGQAYSSHGDEVTVRDASRNQAAGTSVQIGLKDGASGILASLLEIELKNNGPFRDSIRRTAEG